MTLSPTLSLPQAAARTWDVAVIGAGPAGALAAYQIACRGHSVLLVDKADFPRSKVCGSCLNGHALAVLRETGLGRLPAALDAISLQRFVLACGGRRAYLGLPCGVALSREVFDAALVTAAVDAGADFLPLTQAVSSRITDSTRTLVLRQPVQRAEVRARVLLAASGLTGASLLVPDRHPNVRLGSRLGVSLLLPDGPRFYEPGTIYMACARTGYVGVVRVEDNRLNLAAALDPSCLRKGAAVQAQALLASAGLPIIPAMLAESWRGTPALTRRPAAVAAERGFVLGDAAGYIEPFTGEGIGWALASAQAVVPLVCRGVNRWEMYLAAEWTRVYRRSIPPRQWLCRALAAALRRPWLSRALVEVLALAPALSVPFVRSLNRPSTHDTELDHDTRHSGAGYGAAGTRNFAAARRGSGQQALLPNRRAGRGTGESLSSVGN